MLKICYFFLFNLLRSVEQHTPDDIGGRLVRGLFTVCGVYYLHETYVKLYI